LRSQPSNKVQINAGLRDR